MTTTTQTSSVHSTTRFGVLGVGDRGHSLVKTILELNGIGEVTALMDTNRERMEAMAKLMNYPPMRHYDDVGAFLNSGDFDVVLLTTPDWTHGELITRCLDAGYHVFCDKPLANTAKDLKNIIEAKRRSDKMLLVGFNMRSAPYFDKLNEICRRGEIGDILLASCHKGVKGVRYFRRWHKYRGKSGGLIIHKGCHILDVINWTINSCPVEVYSQGSRRVFGQDRPAGKACHSCDEADACPLHQSLTPAQRDNYEKLYLNPSKYDGYTRDYCPRATDADVFDNQMVMIRYENDARCSYTENFFAASEATRLIFSGTDGEAIFDPRLKEIRRTTRLAGETAIYEVPDAPGGHGGADPVMIQRIVKSIETGENLLPSAEEGAAAAIIGVAAMISADQNRPVRIDELIDPALLKR